MNKKVAEIITQSEIGGAQKHVILLSEELAKLDFDVDVYAAPGKLLREALEAKNINFIEVENMVRDISAVKDVKTLIYLYKAFKRKKYDVVHCHSSKAGLLGRMAARLAGNKNIVFTAHGFVFNEPMSRLKKEIYIFLEKVGSIFGHKIITVSLKDYECALEHKLGNEKNVIYIPNAIEKVDVKRLKSKVAMKEELGFREEDFVIGMVANFYENKGHVYLVEALKKLYDEGFNFKMVFVGQGRTLLDIKEKSKEYSDIKFLGYRQDNYDLINCFDLFVLSSIKEGMPLTVLEAMYLNIPVMCTKVGALTNMVEDNINGFIVESKNSEEMYIKLKWILENKKILTSIGAKGNAFVEENFSVDFFVKNIVSVYSNA